MLGFIGIMENKMETSIIWELYWGYIRIVEKIEPTIIFGLYWGCI